MRSRASPTLTAFTATGRSSNCSPLVRMIRLTRLLHWRAMRSRSKRTRGCPLLTRAPCWTSKAKPSPCSSTVSMPTCSSTSAPLSARIVRAWPVRATWITTPAHGACRQSLRGSMAIPSPMAPLANTSSGTLPRVSTGPLRGALRVRSLLLSGMGTVLIRKRQKSTQWVRVTLLRWRGWSGSMPRACARPAAIT